MNFNVMEQKIALMRGQVRGWMTSKEITWYLIINICAVRGDEKTNEIISVTFTHH